MNIEKLQAEFHPGVLKKKIAQGGITLSYIPSYIVIERLNDAIGVNEWSWTVTKCEILSDAVVVCGELRVDQETYSGEDAHDIVQRRGGGGLAPDAMANAIKGASSGALVRAARLLGVGLYLYRNGQLSEADLEERDEERAQARSARQTKASGSGSASPKGNTASRPITELQVRRISELVGELGWEDDELREKCSAAFGCQPEKLSAAQAEEIERRLLVTLKSKRNSSSARGTTLTNRQLNAISAIARALDWTPEALHQHCVDVYRVPLEELTRENASTLIAELQGMSTSDAQRIAKLQGMSTSDAQRSA